MTEEHGEEEPVAHCPSCGAEYRSGFEVCSDCGVPLLAGAAVATDTADGSPLARSEMTDANFTAALAELRAHPDAFVALATLPWVEAHEVAKELWKAGIEAVFVARDDPAAPIDPIADSDDFDEIEDDQDRSAGDEGDGHEGDGGGGSDGSSWEQDPTTWRWQSFDDAERTEDDESRDDEEAEPPPGLERVRGGSVQAWLRPNQPPVASAVLCVRAEDEDEARRVAGRRLGVR